MVGERRVLRRLSSIQYGREILGDSRAFSPGVRVLFYVGKPGGRSQLFEERLIIRRLILRSCEEKQDTAPRGPENRQCTADVLATVIRSRNAYVAAVSRSHRVEDVAFFDDLRLIQMIFQFFLIPPGGRTPCQAEGMRKDAPAVIPILVPLR